MYELDLVIGFNWGRWEEGRKIVARGDYKNQNPVTLLKILTAIIRNDRFNDGALIQAFENRTIEKILVELHKQVMSQ